MDAHLALHLEALYSPDRMQRLAASHALTNWLQSDELQDVFELLDGLVDHIVPLAFRAAIRSRTRNADLPPMHVVAKHVLFFMFENRAVYSPNLVELGTWVYLHFEAAIESLQANNEDCESGRVGTFFTTCNVRS